jgi:uncharacterized protein DUF4062
MKAYLSSTLDDLRSERQAVRDVLAGECIVKESYGASEDDLVTTCIDDVRECDLYIAILGLRYGFVPPGQAHSITYLEYEEARQRGLPRLVFVKEESAITFDLTDAARNEHPMTRIGDFRRRVSSGGPGEPVSKPFKTVDDLRLAVQKAVAEHRARAGGACSLMASQQVHPWALKHDASIAFVPGSDDTLRDSLADCANGRHRVQVMTLSPAQGQEYLPRLDEQARRSRSILLAVSPRSLPRLNERADLVASALRAVGPRCEAMLGLLVDVKRTDLAAPLAAALGDCFESQEADWLGPAREAAFARLQRWRRERVSEGSAALEVRVPYLTLALKAEEASAMNGEPEALFSRFGDAKAERQATFERLQKGLQAAHLDWPHSFYGERRESWRPFGKDGATVDELVLEAAEKANLAPPGSRERALLKGARLRPVRYRFEEYLTNTFGSRPNLKGVCDAGCLVLVDEFALLHPDLRPPIDQLLASNNAAVISLNAADPSHRPLRALLNDESYLRVVNVVSRFREAEDVRCELAVNTVERLQRWIRFVLPELMTTLGHHQSDSGLVGRVDDLLAS